MNQKLERIERTLEEARKLVGKGDRVQASEKLYKVAESCIKLLAELNETPEYEKARKEGGWWTKLLDRAAKTLAEIYGYGVSKSWTKAYELHVKGFHQEALELEDVVNSFEEIESLLRLVRLVLNKKGPKNA